MLKIKEEFDYKSLSRRLDIQLETLIAEHERRQKAFQDEVDRLSLEAQKRIDEAERNFADALEVLWASIIIYRIILEFPFFLLLHWRYSRHQ